MVVGTSMKIELKKSLLTRVALIGCGAASEILYMGTLEKLSKEGIVEVTALVDPNSERTSKIGKTFPLAGHFRDVDTMLAERAPDLAIVVTPHRFHADLAVKCLEKGLHVLCEKPMATTTTDCDRMIEAAEKGECVLAVGHFRRFFPSSTMIKRILDDGLLGAARSFRFLEGEIYSWPAQTGSFFKRADAGGGVLIEAGVHTMDLLLWWLGDVAEVLYQDDSIGGVEANCHLRLKMTSGAQGIVQLSRDWPLPNRYVIECENGWIGYTYDVVNRIEWGFRNSDLGFSSEIRTIAAATGVGMYELGAAVPGYVDCFAAQLRNVVGAIHGTDSLRISSTDARKVVALIEKCYRNRTLLEMPWLGDLEMRRARELANG
jgi:predicted dehydrogenase